MQNITLTGTATNELGAVSPYTGTIQIVEPPVIIGVTVVPQVAPAGTLRTITIVANDPQGLTLSYTCMVGGEPAAPTMQV